MQIHAILVRVRVHMRAYVYMYVCVCACVPPGVCACWAIIYSEVLTIHKNEKCSRGLINFLCHRLHTIHKNGLI